MVQTIKTPVVQPQEKIIIFERPRVLKRVFFHIGVAVGDNTWYPAKISFDDPAFLSYYLIAGKSKYIEAAGVDVFQGNIWIKNEASISLHFSSTEILH